MSMTQARVWFSSIVLLMSALLPALSFADPPARNAELEKKQAKIVLRLYQVTYGSAARCKLASTEAAAQFQSELARFVALNENFIRLMTQSPYYARAREQFARHQTLDPVRDTPEKLAGECTYLGEFLRSMNDTPGGKQSVKEWEEALAR